jgi:hypothetical protein
MAGHPLALFCRPRPLGFPRRRFISALRLLLITLPVALFAIAYFESFEVSPQSFPHQSRTVSLQLPCGSIRGLQKALFENDLYRFHVWTLTHSYSTPDFVIRDVRRL